MASKNSETTHWVARAADSGAKSTWSLTVTEFPRHSVRSVIPRRSDQHPEDGWHQFDRKLYRMRSAVEQCIGWINEPRRIGTRFEKLALNLLVMIHLASIERYLRILFSDRA